MGCVSSKKKVSVTPTATGETISEALAKINLVPAKTPPQTSPPSKPADENLLGGVVEGTRKTGKKKGQSRKVVGHAQEAPTAKVTSKPKTSWEQQMISIALQKHSVLSELSEDVKEVIIDKMKHYLLGPNEVVYEVGESATNLFVVSSGSLEVIVNDTRVNIIKPGESFGEQALLHNTKRAATVRTLERCTLWGLERKSFREAVESVNAKNYQENQAFIDSIGVLKVLTSQQKEALMNVLNPQKFGPGKRIVVEGETGDLLYIIKEGTVSCTIKGLEQRKLTKGDFFGEQALLYNTVRTATVTAVDTVKVFSIGRDQLNEVLGDSLQQVIYRNTMRIMLDKSENLSKLTREQKENLIGKLEVRDYQQGAVVIEAGKTLGKGIWMVLKGNLVRGTEIIAEKLDSYGETELFTGTASPITLDIEAGEATDVSYISLEQLESQLGGKLSSIFAMNEALSVLKRVQIFKTFSKDKFTQLLSALETQSFASDEYIVRQNEEGSAFFIIKSGKVQIEKDGVVLRMINKHDYFGERSILFAEPRTASVVAQGPVSCWILRKNAFNKIIDDTIRTQLVARINLQDDSIRLEELKFVRQLGKGMFGNVTLSVHAVKGTLYALKSVTRQKVRMYDLSSNLILERQLLLQLDHTFIMKLIKTFKDSERVYFLLEYVLGQDLFDVIRVLGLLQDTDAKFYTSCLVLILEHLHERDIIYRDLKPENIMVDNLGYPKLIDFGTAKIVTQGRTFTTVGTPHYTAPEVLTGKGYGISADYWSVGIMLYEFLCGQVPFGEEEEDTYMIYEKVLHAPLVYPRMISQYFPARNLIETLLNRNPSARIAGGIEKIKNNRWFHGYDWVRAI